MAKPEQTKEAKPKTEGDEAAKAKKPKAPMDDSMKVIIINLVTTVLICVLFTSVTYVLMSGLLDSKLSSKMTASADDSGDASADSSGDASADSGGDSDVQKGIVVDLGDFILNLTDVSPRKYLKADVAIEISTKPEDSAPAEGGKKEGGEGAAAAVSPLDSEMAQYKPAIRDAVITTLSSKTSAELATVAGKELAKEQITDAVNGIFAGDREVIRVSFGNFIIQ
jgi:flagellar protein FliL